MRHSGLQDMGEVNRMLFWMAALAGLAVAYLFGSIPTGYLAGRLRGIDIREHGSKSTGATNVLRTLGKGPALVVLVVDVLKGVAAIVFARWFYAWLDTLPSLAPHALAPKIAHAAGLSFEELVEAVLCEARLHTARRPSGTRRTRLDERGYQGPDRRAQPTEPH
jgi:hypothetical protein